MLLPESAEKFISVSSQHKLGKLGMMLNQKSFAIWIQNPVVQSCGYETHQAATTKFLVKNSACSVVILNQSSSFSILVIVCPV
ncbi:hypothetical protein J5751_05890 [bacterium]|nr:hypothetical protein [bacterium]